MRLDPTFRGQVAAHESGISSVASQGDLVAIHAGTRAIVAMIVGRRFGEDETPHQIDQDKQELALAPLGLLEKVSGRLSFVRSSGNQPAIGSQVFAISHDETKSVLSRTTEEDTSILLGKSTQSNDVPLVSGINDLLARHVAIVGSTGEGKTTFVAGVVQRILNQFDSSRIVIFDINGEYSAALSGMAGVKTTTVGQISSSSVPKAMRIPYYALNRVGLVSTLLPSERAQMPALRFAVESLPFIDWNGKTASVHGQNDFCLVDDCRSDGAENAWAALNHLRTGPTAKAQQWPHMRALACLVAEWGCLQKDGRGKASRNAFQYGNVQPLVNRIRGLCEDPQFTAVVDVAGGPPTDASEPELDLGAETSALIERLFGQKNDTCDWRAHVLDLHQLPQDLMPAVLGSLLDLFGSELFRRGPGSTHPTLLVLEEAHHYLRQQVESQLSGHPSAYERLAKEGRKFNLSLMLSTQRPSELSQTVLSQCGTWVVFRLSGDRDQRSVRSMGDWGELDSSEVKSLRRGEAFVLGAGVNFPTRIHTVIADPLPDSHDANFARTWQSAPPE